MTKDFDFNILDDEERQIVEAMNDPNYTDVSLLIPEKLQEYQKAARNTINEASQRIQLRIPRTDLARVKAKTLQEWIPYQTYIKSLIHKDVNLR